MKSQNQSAVKRTFRQSVAWVGVLECKPRERASLRGKLVDGNWESRLQQDEVASVQERG